MFLFLVCSTKESAACSVACLLLLLLSINSSRFLLDSLLHLCTSLPFLLSSSCGFLTLSTDASQALQGGLRFRLRIREITKSEQSFLREFAGNTPPSVAASLARAYIHKTAQQLLLLSRDFHLQLAITIHRSFSLIYHTSVGYPHPGDSNFRFQTRWSWACSFQRPTLDLGIKEVLGASALP